MRAGRIRKSELPEGVWVVVWFEFTKGSYRYPSGQVIDYRDAWHIAFAKRSGSHVEIHDSEVHSGARQPYAALAAVEAWFAAYGTRYVGWSTDCDGRNYVKEVTIVKNSIDSERVIAKGILGRDGLNGRPDAFTDPNTNPGIEKSGILDRELTPDRLIEAWRSAEAEAFRRDVARTYQERDALKEQVAQLKKQLADAQAGNFELLDQQVYVKK